jgi:aryl-alcohol dehydrogenase-like predicted oxidoreductase
MKTKQLGNSDLYITPVGFGSRAIGGAGWQFAWEKQNDADSVAAIHCALGLGINWTDTAAVYGMGHSEEIVARTLASWPGPRPYVFTKCGMRWDAKGKTRCVVTSASIRKECVLAQERLPRKKCPTRCNPSNSVDCVQALISNLRQRKLSLKRQRRQYAIVPHA